MPLKDPEAKRAYDLAYHKRNRKRLNEYQVKWRAEKNWREANRHKIKAHGMVKRVPLKPCEVCGDTKSERHHDDYSKPLQIRFLCHKHHMALCHSGKTS